MILTFRPLKVRPEGWRLAGDDRPRSPFAATYARTLAQLDVELRHLDARDAFLQVETDSRGLRLDGQLRADAHVTHPGVVLTIDTARLGTLVYETDVFEDYPLTDAWKANLRAITLGLEALRRVERYGIAQRGEQYAGFMELPAIAMGSGWTIETAALYIAEHAGDSGWPADVEDPAFALALFKDAAKLYHPDQGGDPDVMAKLTSARDYLAAVFPDYLK